MRHGLENRCVHENLDLFCRHFPGVASVCGCERCTAARPCGSDQERTGWNRAETILSPKNVKGLKQLWSTQLNVPVDKYVLSTMTAPVLVAGVQTAQGPKDLLFVHGANDALFAVDANTGQQVWSKSFTNPNKSTAPVRDWLCPKTPNATPTIDKARGIVFFITNDGMLRGLNLADGADRLTPVSM